MINPVDGDFMKPLVRALQSHIDSLEESMLGIPEERRHRVASAWVYTSALVAWAEDHGLVPMWLRADAASRRDRHLALGGTMRQWLYNAFASLALHPSTECLLDQRYNPITSGQPGEDACRELVRWWSTEAPDFAYQTDNGPTSITGWLVGDLLQLIGDERRKGNALCQTPWWIADFLIERTVVPAAGGHPNETLRVIDPASGTGHILIRIMQCLHLLYTGEGPNGWKPVSTAVAVDRIMTGLHGVELDPMTAAVARLRMTVLAGVFLAEAGVIQGPLRLAAIPASIRPRVAVGNSLLAGLDDPCPAGTVIDDTADYPGILKRGTYHAVVANPPYITVKDKVTKEAIREAYSDVCSGNYSLGVPFTKLCFDLAIREEDTLEQRIAIHDGEPNLFQIGEGVAS